MSKRLVSLALLMIVAASSSGCRFIYCLHDNLIGLYKSRRWADCGCGEVYYGPWIDTPPACCDPCDHCGSFHGKRYWTSANSWLNNSRQSYNPWAGGNPHPNHGGQPTAAPPMEGIPSGTPIMDDSLDGVPQQGEMIGPGGTSMQAGPQMSPYPSGGRMQPTPADPPSGSQLNPQQQGPPPSYYPPRTGRRPRGIAGAQNPYGSNQVYPASGYGY